jgi:hypothetical protein
VSTASAVRTCAYCHAAGDLEAINATSVACRATVACQLRAQGFDPVQLALDLARDYGKLAARDPRALSTRDRARLSLVLRAASDWLVPSGRADSAVSLEQARHDLGCKRCGAMGPGVPCVTRDGHPLPWSSATRGWHAGRQF